MAAYVIIRVRVTDMERYREYMALSPDTIRRYDGEFVVRGGRLDVLEGPEEDRRVVLLKFPSMERAREWYDSPEYTAARNVREGAAEAEFLAIGNPLDE